MTRSLTATALALVLMGAPAFAQSDQQQTNTDRSAAAGGQPGGQQSGGDMKDGQQAATSGMQDKDRQQAGTSGMRGEDGQEAAASGMTPEQMVVSQRRVIAALNEAGFSDVQIMDAAYLVQARTDNDEQVMMVVNSAGQPVRSNQARTVQ